jgi:hypothetical protein
VKQEGRRTPAHSPAQRAPPYTSPGSLPEGPGAKTQPWSLSAHAVATVVPAVGFSAGPERPSKCPRDPEPRSD